GGRGGSAAGPRSASAENAREPHPIRASRTARCAGARLYPVQAILEDAARALDLGPPALEAHVALARLSLAPALGGEGRTGIEQRLTSPLDRGIALDILEPQQIGETGMAKGSRDEPGGSRPARGIGLELRVSRVAEEAGDGNVREAD